MEYLVYLIEKDVYARQALVSFLSWDRRTRVIGTVGTSADLAHQDDPVLDRLDVVLLDTSLAENTHDLVALIDEVRAYLPQVDMICLGHCPENEAAWTTTARQAGARAYLIRGRVGAGIANAVRYSMAHAFTITADITYGLDAQILPGRRSYPRLTRRIEQALRLCVVEGLPAELAAREMGVSTSTVRSYIKEGYRILEAYDDTVYPDSVSPAERAFLRYTALDTCSAA